MPDLSRAVTYYIAFLLSVTIHEAAHAWAAKLGGDLTAYHGGQVSLDPRPHIRREPFGMVILPLLSIVTLGLPIGFASAPYDPRWALRYPNRAALMALAGPGANLLLFLIAFAMIRVGTAMGYFAPPHTVSFGEVATGVGGGMWASIAFVVGVFFSMNLLLTALNLIPLPPLDGSAAIPLLLPPAAATRYQQWLFANPALSLVGMLVAWFLFGRVYQPIFLLVINLLHPGAGYG